MHLCNKEHNILDERACTGHQCQNGGLCTTEFTLPGRSYGCSCPGSAGGPLCGISMLFIHLFVNSFAKKSVIYFENKWHVSNSWFPDNQTTSKGTAMDKKAQNINFTCLFYISQFILFFSIIDITMKD